MEDPMKKIIGAALVLSLVFAGVAFGQVKAKDGVYYAEDEAYGPTGWKEQVVVKVAAGKITDVTWNGVPNSGVADRRTVLPVGGYPMVKFGKAKAEWDVQAKAVQDYLLKTQDIAFDKYSNAEGNTDAIAGATIHVKYFFTLVNKALAAGPVAKGPFKKDGWFFTSAADFDKASGWKDNVLVTVVNGTIVNVIWNGVSSDTKKKSKLVEALAGKYGMAKAAKQGEWNVQAARVEQAIVKAGDPAKIPLKADGTTDAITGATLHPAAVSLAVEALKAAR